MFAQGWWETVPHRISAAHAMLRCPVEVWTRGSEMQRVDADLVDHGHHPLGHRAPVDMLERRRWHTSTRLRRTWKWLVVVLVANEGCVVLARHSGQPGVVWSVHPLLQSVSHCSSPGDSEQKPEQGLVEHPTSTIAGQRPTDGADRSKIGRQLPLAPAWTADCQAPRRDLWRSSLTPRLTTSGGVESQLGKLLPIECPARSKLKVVDPVRRWFCKLF